MIEFKLSSYPVLKTNQHVFQVRITFDKKDPQKTFIAKVEYTLSNEVLAAWSAQQTANVILIGLLNPAAIYFQSRPSQEWTYFSYSLREEIRKQVIDPLKFSHQYSKYIKGELDHNDNPVSLLTSAVPSLLKSATCPAKTNVTNCLDSRTISRTIIHLNDFHQWSREAIADWLESLDIDLRFVVE